MDPRHGELSRALRNRGVEICILGEVNLCFVDIVVSSCVLYRLTLLYSLQESIKFCF